MSPMRIDPMRFGCRALLALALAASLAACTNAPATASLAELLQRPAEHALAEGLRNYGDGAFVASEHDFHAALKLGLLDARDTAVAHKHLAFVACAYQRLADCDLEFRAAFAADPAFHLSESEIGHPIWGPVYRRVAAQMASRGGAGR